MSSENSEVVKTVIESGGKILLARSREAGCWEFPTVETGENLEDKAIQITEEVTGSDEIEAENLRPGDSYREEKSRVTPVYVELNEERKELIKEKTLSDSYTEVEWIDVKEFDEFNTGEEYRALEHLDIVNGRVALAFVERDGKFLAVKRSEENSTPGKWSTVSGGIESGETPEEAAVRELSEETGLEAEVERKGEYYIGRGENGVWRLEPVLMSYRGGEVDLNWELSDHRWVKPEEVENLDTIGELKGFDKLGLR
jgi:8-oxo-dGTP pyrophosphatase MutT (NUDIX family)